MGRGVEGGREERGKEGGEKSKIYDFFKSTTIKPSQVPIKVIITFERIKPQICGCAQTKDLCFLISKHI